MTQSGPSPGTPSDLPERIGKYDIVKLLGKGAMGVVYQAFDPLLERDVALKVMLPQIADDPEQKNRFEREARAVAKMMHPNVVMVFDLGYHSDGSPYIAMELLKGQDLLEALKEAPALPFEKKVSIILQVLDGVGHAHEAGIVHRDIKPANTFLNLDGTVKIMDFGVARLTAASMTATGIVVGTANYMSPEQVNGAKVDGRSDLFSVGCMLYELALGRLPFQSDSLITTLWKIVHEEPNLEIPAGPEYAALLPILRRALAKNPDERFQTASVFADALRELMSRQARAGSGIPASAGDDSTETAASQADTMMLGQGSSPRAAPMSALGRPALDPAPLFRLMREIYAGAKSGHIHFTHGRERRSLQVLRGHIVHGTSDVPGQHLGDILVRYGLLTQTDLQRAIEIVLRDRKRLGVVLKELGLMDPDRLHEAVGLHVQQILFEAAGRSDGSCSFEELGPESVPESGTAFAIGEMILETARQIQAPDVVRRVLGDVGKTLSLSTEPLLRSQRLPLTPTDGFLLSRIDGVLTAREVFELIPLPIEDVEHSLFGLLCTGIVEYVPSTLGPVASSDAGRAAVPAAEGTRIIAPQPQGPPVARASAERPAGGAPAVAERRAAEVQQANERRRREILAAHEELGKNHFEVLGIGRNCSAAQVREGYFRRVKPFLPDAPLDRELADLRKERQAVYERLLEAYQTLRDPVAREKYQDSLDARLLRSQLQPPAPPPPPPPLAVSLLADGPAGAHTLIEALRDAQRLLKNEEPWEAIKLLEALIPKAEGHHRFRAQVLLARAYCKNPKWVKRAEELLHRVVREAPEHAEAYVVLGHIYRASEMPTRAHAMYRKALELQPGHHEAVEGLATLIPPDPEQGGGAGLRKLLRKDP